VVLGVLNVSTYWEWPPAISRSSADIQPKDLGELDRCSFCPPTPLSGLTTRPALWQDRELLVPPFPILVPSEDRPPSVILAATVPTELFESDQEKIIVRIFGFSATEPGARIRQLNDIINSRVNSSPFGTLTARYDEARREARLQGQTEGEAFRLIGASWTIRPLAEISVAEPGPFKVTTPMDESIDGIAIECSRGVLAAGNEPRPRCMEVNYLASPNEGDEFVVPREIPQSQLTRRAHGTVIIDARGLDAGDYVLPTFDYDFVDVEDSSGSAVPTYTFNRRPVIEHVEGTTSYTITYDFGPERLAVLSGIVLFVVAMMVIHVWRRSSPRPLAESQSAESLSGPPTT
jgi:hypothetical protein